MAAPLTVTSDLTQLHVLDHVMVYPPMDMDEKEVFEPFVACIQSFFRPPYDSGMEYALVSDENGVEYIVDINDVVPTMKRGPKISFYNMNALSDFVQ